MVLTAILALRAFGVINRSQAVQALKLWAHSHQLDQAGTHQVLKAFPA